MVLPSGSQIQGLSIMISVQVCENRQLVCLFKTFGQMFQKSKP